MGGDNVNVCLQILTKIGRSADAGNALFSFMTAAAVVAEGDAATGRSVGETIPEYVELV